MAGSAYSRPFANVGYLFATLVLCPICDVLQPMHINAIFRAATLRAVGPDPMNFFRGYSGWTLVFAILVSAVVGDAFGIWMGWLSTH